MRVIFATWALSFTHERVIFFSLSPYLFLLIELLFVIVFRRENFVVARACCLKSVSLWHTLTLLFSLWLFLQNLIDWGNFSNQLLVNCRTSCLCRFGVLCVSCHLKCKILNDSDLKIPIIQSMHNKRVYSNDIERNLLCWFGVY